MSDSPLDPLATQLRAIAPAVDLEASRRLFERGRAASSGSSPRWLLPAAVFALLVAGLVGVWALARDDGGTIPADRPQATGTEFEVLTVEQTSREFGWIGAADSADDYPALWAEALPGLPQADVDLGRYAVVAFTLPDDACPDVLVGFDIEPGRNTNDPPVWTPRLEVPPGGCDQPLLSWAYVVAIDRLAAAPAATFALPANGVFDMPAADVTVRITPPTRSTVPATEPDLVALDVRVPLPPVGEPQLVTGTFGLVWVVQHDDGSVSVLDAVIDQPVDDDDGGVTGLGDLVRPTDDRLGFVGGRFVWDAFGRTLNGARSADLGGFSGVVVDDEVELFRTSTTRIDGDPVGVPLDTATSVDLTPVLPLVELDRLPTFSFLGPIWRQLGATLVVEGGVGRLCEIDQDPPVPDLATCGEGAVTTAVTSAQPTITSWFFGPVLAEFDELGTIVRVVPRGGQASRNDGPDGAPTLPVDDGWRELPPENVSWLSGTPRLMVADDELARSGADADTVVLVVDVLGNDCRPRLINVLLDTTVVKVRFASGGVECGESLVDYRFAIEIDRDRLADRFTVEVPDEVGGPARSVEFDLDGDTLVGDSKPLPSGDGWRLLPEPTIDREDPTPKLLVTEGQLGSLPVDAGTEVVLELSVIGPACDVELSDAVLAGSAMRLTFSTARPACRAMLTTTRFRFGIDRDVVTDQFAVTAPVWLGQPPMTTRFDGATGSVIEGGLLVGNPVVACADPGGAVVRVDVASATRRSYSILLSSDDGTVWEVAGSGPAGVVTIGGGLDLRLDIAAGRTLVARSGDPDASFERPFSIDQGQIDELTETCG